MAIDVSNSSHEYIKDMIVTDNYIIVTGYGTNSHNKKTCVTMLLSKSGTVLSQKAVYNTSSTKSYECKTLAMDGTNVYVGGVYADSSSSTYESFIIKYSLSSDKLSAGSTKYGPILSSSPDINSMVILGDSIYLAGSYGDDFYVEQWTFPGLIDTLSYQFDSNEGLSSTKTSGDTIKKILKDDSGNLYLIGYPGDWSQWMVVRLTNSSGVWAADTSFGASGFARFKTSDATTSASYTYYTMLDAELDSENNICVAGSVSNDFFSDYNAYVACVSSDGLGINFDALEDGSWGCNIAIEEDLVYVTGSKPQSDSGGNWIISRYADGTKDTSFGNNGSIVTDINKNLDWPTGLSINDGEIYIGGWAFITSSTTNFALASYNVPSYSETCTATESPETTCNDSTDNDCDGLADCDDDNCTDSYYCWDGSGGSTKETDCTDGTDNDGDGLTDCDDNDCVFDSSCVPEESSIETDCFNGSDDDADGAIDCDDADCTDSEYCAETDCADDTDNDGDGYTDCEDSECSQYESCVEIDCTDSIDNDADGDTDCNDSDCALDEACITTDVDVDEGSSGCGCKLTRAPQDFNTTWLFSLLPPMFFIWRIRRRHAIPIRPKP